VTFTLTTGGVRVEADIRGLTPGPHGFHIHEFGDCSSPDAMSTGGHFNPTKSEHGAPASTKRHVGDLGNIEADDDGHATLDLIDPALAFSGPNSIIGRGLVVHEKADDLKTQPTGNAGGRLAVGVIGIAKAVEPAKAK
jgi:Cu-Zn family superoxide dismutase